MTDSFKLDGPLKARESARDATGGGASAGVGDAPRGPQKN